VVPAKNAWSLEETHMVDLMRGSPFELLQEAGQGSFKEATEAMYPKS
jgi:hypothetical protein